jgi:hypothetical protein
VFWPSRKYPRSETIAISRQDCNSKDAGNIGLGHRFGQGFETDFGMEKWEEHEWSCVVDEMLHQMCHEVLAEADVRAICKNRGLPNQAMSSRPLLENLFLSDTGVAAAMRTLDRTEIALLHLLESEERCVDVSFFSPLDPPRSDRWSHVRFTRRYQGVFAKVKERLVRKGILLIALGPETAEKQTKMERWQFALPIPFTRHLPPLIESGKRLSGTGDWRRDVGREKLRTAVGQGTNRETRKDRVEIVNGELRWDGQPFRADRVLEWQKRQWQAETKLTEHREEADPYTLLPAEAVLRILAGLDADLWTDANTLAVPLEIFCEADVDAGSVCESGWRWGFLARQEAESRKWYRLAPPSVAADAPPDQYLAVRGEGVAVDLDTVPFEALEALVSMSDQRQVPGGQPLLLVTPNLVKLGRTADTVAALPLTEWLRKNAPAFQQALETVRQRHGKTILHENLLVARVSDLSLKVALEKALGRRSVALGGEFLAFPSEAVSEVKRLVSHLGHVVKEVSHGEP